MDKSASVLQDWAGFAAGSGHSSRFPPADGLCVEVMAALPDKQYLYMVLGMVNICAVKALEFNLPSPHFPFVLRADQHNNETRGGEKKI